MRSLVVAALVLAALIGASAAADAHCEVTYNTYTDKACTAGEVKLDFSKQQGTVKDTCVKTGQMHFLFGCFMATEIEE